MINEFRTVMGVGVAAWLVAVSVSFAQPGRRGEMSESLTPEEELGKRLFFDENLSTPPGQSCAACHALDAGWTGPIGEINATGAVYPGAVHTRFGNRKPPSSGYAGNSPVLHFDEDEGLFVGGMFWDGRATGETLGDPLAEQAMGPFLNRVEQKTPHEKQVCVKIRHSNYADLFEQVWGPGSLDCNNDVEATYEKIARSIAAYERSAEVNPYSSKFDFYLRGEAQLTPEEEWGRQLFSGKGQCVACHSGIDFTDFTYDNLGVPKNPENPWYAMPPSFNRAGADWVDPGLGGFLMTRGDYSHLAQENYGKHKVPTLRNVDRRPYEGFVKAYTHNGVFKSLKQVVHFYNTRDVLPDCSGVDNPEPGVNCWPAPEVEMNVNNVELGDLGLTDAEEDAIVSFMKTLTDGYQP